MAARQLSWLPALRLRAVVRVNTAPTVALNQRMRLLEIGRIDRDHCFCQQSNVAVWSTIGRHRGIFRGSMLCGLLRNGPVSRL